VHSSATHGNGRTCQIVRAAVLSKSFARRKRPAARGIGRVIASGVISLRGAPAPARGLAAAHSRASVVASAPATWSSLGVAIGGDGWLPAAPLDATRAAAGLALRLWIAADAIHAQTRQRYVCLFSAASLFAAQPVHPVYHHARASTCCLPMCLSAPLPEGSLA